MVLNKTYGLVDIYLQFLSDVIECSKTGTSSTTLTEVVFSIQTGLFRVCERGLFTIMCHSQLGWV